MLILVGKPSLYPNGCPKAVYISPYLWRVQIEDMEQCDDGRMLPGVNLIRLNEGLVLERLQMTLWHEINHAIWHTLDLQSTEEEEDVIEKMSPKQVEVLRLNPELSKFLGV